jgi:hypothetical protein
LLTPLRAASCSAIGQSSKVTGALEVAVGVADGDGTAVGVADALAFAEGVDVGDAFGVGDAFPDADA